MKYIFFEIENFKGIRRTRLDLGSDPRGRVHALVGLNESGKTTVLEAIDHFQPQDDERDVSPKQLAGWEPPDPHELIPISERTNFNGEIKIRCGIELDDSDVSAVTAELNKETGFRLSQLETSIQIEDLYKFENSRFKTRRTLWTNLRGRGRTPSGRKPRPLTAQMNREQWIVLARLVRQRLPVIWFFPNFLFDFPSRIYLQAADGDSPSNRFYRALMQDILNALDRDLNLDKHIVDRAVSESTPDKANLQQLLLEVSRHVTTTVLSQWDKMLMRKALSGKTVRVQFGFDNPESRSGLYLEFHIEDAAGLFSVAERSLGFRWFFVYLLLTNYRGRRKDVGHEMLFLFDEPASNLHPTAQSALLNSLGQLSKQATIIYTTHSHHLINPEWLETAYVVRNTGLDVVGVSTSFTAHRTDIVVDRYRSFAAQHPNQAQFFQPILDVLDYTPSKLEHVPAVVMVEGKTDFYLLALLQRLLRLPAKDRLNWLPGGGAGSLTTPIQLYLGWSRPFVVLLDSDSAGRRERERYVEHFGEALRPRFLDLEAVSGTPGAKGMESLLPDADKLTLQQVANPSAGRFDKKEFSRGVQEALMSRKRIALTPQARSVGRSVLKALRAKLDTLVKQS